MNIADTRIAHNTLYMYIRLIATMVIGLYVSRLAIALLGVSDYGLFSVVGGVLAMFTFISSSLASATSRFFNIEMGKEGGDVNASFNINLVLHCAVAALVLLLAETIGLWYVCRHLNVEPGKLYDAVFVYQVSILTACLGIVNTPYQSLLTAHEQFGFLALVDIANALLRLACVLGLTLLPEAGVRLYSLIFALTTATSFVAYHYRAFRGWRDTIRPRFVGGWGRYREVLVFNNWNLLATMAYMANSSGVDLLFNAFFGTPMNGAFAVSKTVKTSIMNFTGNFDTASAPQIVQSYAAGDRYRYTYLCHKLGRINILMFELLCFPLLVELHFVLHLWLGKVPAGAYELTFLAIIQGGVALTAGGIYNLINATGRIKWFKINVSFFFLVCLPLGYWMFSLGMPYYAIVLLLIAADIVQRAIQLLLMHRLLGFDSLQYVRKAYLRPAVIAAVMTLLIYVRAQFTVDAAALRLLVIATTAALTAVLVYHVGLTGGERKAVREKMALTRKLGKNAR